MLQKLQVNHLVYSTTRSFDEVVRAFEAAVGMLEDIGWASIPGAAKDTAEFEARVTARIGSSGFTRFLTVDHGGWLSFYGQPREARQYVIGNPLIAITMLRHHVGAGLNVPVRVYIYRDEANGTTRFEYDEPSTLMSGLDNEGVTAAAEKLDAKLTALAEQVTGTRALAATVITNSRVPAEPRTDMRISTVEINVEHVTIDTDKPYLEVTARIEGELKRLDDTYRTLLRENRIDEVRSKLAQGAQPNGLMLHYIAPHGDWLALVGQRSPGIVYHIGNVSMAVQMTQHTLRAGLYAPLRVAVYGNSHGGTTFEFDKPSSQFGQFHDSHIDAVAKELDKRLLLLIEKVSR